MTTYGDYTDQTLADILDTPGLLFGGELKDEVIKRLHQFDEKGSPEQDCTRSPSMNDAELRMQCLSLAKSITKPGSHHQKIVEAAKAFESFVLGEPDAD